MFKEWTLKFRCWTKKEQNAKNPRRKGTVAGERTDRLQLEMSRVLMRLGSKLMEITREPQRKLKVAMGSVEDKCGKRELCC